MARKVIDKQLVYQGRRIRLELHHLEDDQGHRIVREVGIHNGAVVILPILDEQTIILIRNRRFTIGGYLVELPAGGLEKGEDPMNAAGRELLEETGYVAGRLVRLLDFYSSPGILSEKMYTFAAYDLQPARQDLQDDEEIEVLEVPMAEAIQMIRDGRIVDGKTIATLLMYERFFKGVQAAVAEEG